MVYQRLKRWFGVVCCLSSCSVTAHAVPILPRHANVPGGVAVIAIDLDSNEPPVVHYQQMRTLVMPDPNHKDRWLTVVGLPLDAKPGTHNIQISTTSGTVISKDFNIKQKLYHQERLTIADMRKVQPLAEDLPIIEQQRMEIIGTYSNWNYKPVTSAVLVLPAKGRKSSPFGLTRVMNNIPQNPHTGLDIAAPKGAAVYAPKAGMITMTGNYFYSGNMVFIDHGQGFITSYCHLDSIKVATGQTVKQGDIIGTIGNTGRATGPHLHWSVSLNNVRVDPQWFIYE